MEMVCGERGKGTKTAHTRTHIVYMYFGHHRDSVTCRLGQMDALESVKWTKPATAIRMHKTTWMCVRSVLVARKNIELIIIGHVMVVRSSLVCRATAATGKWVGAIFLRNLWHIHINSIASYIYQFLCAHGLSFADFLFAGNSSNSFATMAHIVTIICFCCCCFCFISHLLRARLRRFTVNSFATEAFFLLRFV